MVALNGSGRAPAAASIDWFEQHGITALTNTSPHTVTIPGAVSAWETLLAAHGTQGLDELLQPAIRFAEEGWSGASARRLDWADAAEKLRATGADAFLPGGRAPAVGDLFVQPQLAETLRAIARDGARAFYEGPIAADMVATLRARGGLHTEADFAAGRTAAHFVEPIRIAWRGHEVWQCPPNGSGLLVLMLLGILGGLDPAPEGPLGVTRLHRHLEAGASGLSRPRRLPRRPAANRGAGRAADRPRLSRRPARPDPRRPRRCATCPRAGEAELPAHRDTVYLCVVDRDGNACSFINSLFDGFGSGILAEKSGVMLHNRGLGFRLQRGHPNCIAPEQAADAHDHSRHGHAGRRGGDAATASWAGISSRWVRPCS